MFGNMIYRMSPDRKLAVEKSIAEAEKNTSAEIYAVLAERSDNYRFVAYSLLAFWIFVVSVLIALYIRFEDPFAGGAWISTKIPDFYFLWAQLLAFVCGVAVFSFFPALAGLVVPRRVAHERAHVNAVRQFLAHGIHHTEQRTGVLVFVSLQERYGEIIVDRLIEEKIGRQYFLDEVALMLKACDAGHIDKALEQTIDRLGEKLAIEFPGSPSDRNELADKLVVM